MMWDLVTDGLAIRHAQQRLREILVHEASRSISCRVGYQGGHMQIRAHWIDGLGIWFATKTLKDEPIPRYWNAFGVDQPKDGSMIDIVCEVNPPITGVARQIEGAFARDRAGGIHLLHRGGIGGGRRGIGRTAFFSHFKGERVVIRDDGLEAEMALIADLRSPRFARQMSIFVKDVHRIKALAVANGDAADGDRPILSTSSPFWAEPIKRRSYRVSGLREPSADHGIIVNALEALLRQRKMKTGKTINKDLVIRGPRGDAVIFEVKTGGTLASVYEAIGQLLFHSAGGRCRLVLVSPPLLPRIASRIRKLQIEHLAYSLTDGEPRFSRLAGLL